MIITEAHLRRIIRNALMCERRTIATVSDVTKFKPQVEEWSEVLIDELAEFAPRMKEMDEKRRKSAVSALADKVVSTLVDVTSGMSSWDKSRIDKKEMEKAHQEWDKKRKQRGGGVRYYGEYGSSG